MTAFREPFPILLVDDVDAGESFLLLRLRLRGDLPQRGRSRESSSRTLRSSLPGSRSGAARPAKSARSRSGSTDETTSTPRRCEAPGRRSDASCCPDATSRGASGCAPSSIRTAISSTSGRSCDRELAAGRREARPRSRADGRPGSRRARRPRARQRPLPDQLLGHEGLRRRRLPARGRPGADLPRGLGGGCGADGWTHDSASSTATTRATRGRRDCARSTSPARSRRELRAGRARARRSARRRPTGWSASRRPIPRRGSTRSRTPPTRRRSSPRRARSRPSRRSSGCGSRTRSRPARWSTSASASAPGMKESEVGAMWNGWVHGHGTGCEGKVELALGFSLVWSGPGIRTFTATGDRPCRSTSRRCSRSGSAPTATGATTRRTSAPAS